MQNEMYLFTTSDSRTIFSMEVYRNIYGNIEYRFGEAGSFAGTQIRTDIIEFLNLNGLGTVDEMIVWP